MRLTELMQKASTEEELGQELEQRRQAQLKELNDKRDALTEQIDTLSNEPVKLKDALRRETKEVAKEKGFTSLEEVDDIGIYERETNLLFLPREPERYLLLQANPNARLSKKKTVTVVLANYFPEIYADKLADYNREGNGAFRMAGIFNGVGGAFLGGAYLLEILHFGLFMGGTMGTLSLFPLAIGTWAALGKRRIKRKEQKLSKIENDIRIYQGIEAIRELEGM